MPRLARVRDARPVDRLRNDFSTTLLGLGQHQRAPCRPARARRAARRRRASSAPRTRARRRRRACRSAARRSAPSAARRCFIFLLTRISWRVRLRAVRDAAADPLGRADRALTGAAGPLLTPRLLAAAGDLAAGLGRVRARADTGEARRHDLVHQRHVDRDSNTSAGRSREPVFLPATSLSSIEAIRRPSLSFAGALTAERTMTRPPFGPGTAPLTAAGSRSGSACDHLEVQDGDALVARAGRPSACP